MQFKKKTIIALISAFTFISITACQSPGQNKEIDVVTSVSENDMDHYVSLDKPVIYLYGYDNEEVTVKLDFSGKVTCSYPELKNNTWTVTAKKDGTIIDSDGKEYRYLYWEGKGDAEFTFDKGFCVKGSETASFLETELEKLGLNRTESNDFITYWLPYMQNNKYNVISFQTKAYTNMAQLSISPKPDKLLRIFMAYYPSEEEVTIPKQSFNVPKRSGKIAVEWGGSEVNPSTKQPVSFADKLSEAEKSSESIDEMTETDNAPAHGTLNGNMLTLDISDPTSAAILQRYQIFYVQQQALKNNLGTTQGAAAGGHAFTDKNGNKTTFTNAEWEKLKSVWAYTGKAEEMISHHTIGELRNVLATM